MSENQSKEEIPIYKKWWFWLIAILILTNIFKDKIPSSSSSYSSKSRSCSYCSKSVSGSGWESVSGEQYQPSSGDGLYCSRKCAYDAQPSNWKR